VGWTGNWGTGSMINEIGSINWRHYLEEFEINADSRICFKLFNEVFNLWLSYSVITYQNDRTFQRPPLGIRKKEHKNQNSFLYADKEKIYFLILYHFFINPKSARTAEFKKFIDKLISKKIVCDERINIVLRETASLLSPPPFTTNGKKDFDSLKKKINRARGLLLDNGYCSIALNPLSGDILLISSYNNFDKTGNVVSPKIDKAFYKNLFNDEVEWERQLHNMPPGIIFYDFDFKVKLISKIENENIATDNSSKCAILKIGQENQKMPNFLDLYMEEHFIKFFYSEIFNENNIKNIDETLAKKIVENKFKI